MKLNEEELPAVTVAIGMVLSAEALNSAIERICDFVQPDRDHHIKVIKDLSAGAVLLCAIAAAVIGVIVFLPKTIDLFK